MLCPTFLDTEKFHPKIYMQDNLYFGFLGILFYLTSLE